MTHKRFAQIRTVTAEYPRVEVIHETEDRIIIRRSDGVTESLRRSTIEAIRYFTE